MCIFSDTTVISRFVPSQPCLKALEFFNDVVQAGVDEEGFASWAQVQSFEGQVPNGKHARSRNFRYSCGSWYVVICRPNVLGWGQAGGWSKEARCQVQWHFIKHQTKVIEKSSRCNAVLVISRGIEVQPQGLTLEQWSVSILSVSLHLQVTAPFLSFDWRLCRDVGRWIQPHPH